MSKKIVDLILIGAVIFAVVGCASGGGSAGVPTTNAPPSGSTGGSTPTQPYQTIQPIVYNYSLDPDGDGTPSDFSVTYQSGTYRDESQFPKTDKYKIADYGFFEITTTGRHSGVTGIEAQDPGPFRVAGKVHRADLDGDGHEDFYYEDFFEGNRDDMPRSYLHAFLNDGNGHFIYSPDIFEGSTCINYGDLDFKDDPNHECGFNTHLQRGLVADFNGDGIDDFWRTGNYFLSSDGKIVRQDNLQPDFFFDPLEDSWMSGQYTHDQYAGDADGDGDLDIVGNYHGVMTMLINDGAGSFKTVNTNFPYTGRMSANTAVIGDFNNDGMGDVAVGWMRPEYAFEEGFGNTYQHSAGAVFWNDGNNDWSTRWSELPDNYYGANGNANDMEVIDINGDGLLDIILASTRWEPYYEGRAVQFFLNNGNETFTDVTSSYNPGIGKYDTGSGNSWWNGEGTLSVLDFDRDGDLDIVDSVNNTYVLLNNGNGVFEMYNDYPRLDNCGGCMYYPVEIDGKWQYDFIAYTDEPSYNSHTATFFQVLDPPLMQMMQDITTKPEGYAKTVFNSKMLLDGVRDATRGSNILFNYTDGSSMFGYSGNINDEYGFFIAQLDGTSTGGVVGFDFDHDNLHTGVYYVDNTLEAFNDTIWYGTGTADVDYNSINTFTEFVYFKDNIVYSVGGGFAYTTVQSFTERDSAVNVKVNSFTMLDMTVFADVKYVTQSRFGTTAIGLGIDHYQSLSTTDINFADVLKYEFKDRLTVGSIDFVHSYGPLYFKASANTESLNTYELGFIVNL